MINIFGGGRETTKWLRALDLVEDLGLIHSELELQIPRDLKSSSASMSSREIHGVYTHM